MDANQIETLIEQLLDNSFFRMSMIEELQKIVDIQKPSLPTPAIHMLVQEIMGHITMVIEFKIKEILDEQYSVLADRCVKINSELESIRVRVDRVEERGKERERDRFKQNIENRRESIAESQISILGTQRHLTSKLQSNSSFKYTKLKQQIDTIKLNLQKHSYKQILAFIAETNQQINNKIDTQYERLYNQIQNNMKNTSILGGRSVDFTGDRYETLEHKIDGLTGRFNSFQGLMEERYESNFRNVWNVISDLGLTLSGVKNKQKEKDKEKEENSAKEGGEKKGISSFFGWK